MIFCSHFCCLGPLVVSTDAHTEKKFRRYHYLQVIYLLYDEWHRYIHLSTTCFFPYFALSELLDWWMLNWWMLNVPQRTSLVYGYVLQDWPNRMLSHSAKSCQDN